MKTENKVIRAFIEYKKQMTIREIAKQIKADYRITHTAVQRLIHKGILLTRVVGKSSLCSLNTKYYGVEIYQAEEERRRELLKNRDINQLYRDVMAKINNSFFVFLLFGSYVRGRQTKGSDIDLMFVTNEKKFEEEVHNVLSLLPLKTHVLLFTEKEFKRMLDAKKSNVVKEAVKNCIIIYGIESFYRMKNA